MTANKLRLNRDKMDVLLVGSSLVVGCGCTPKLALTPKTSVHSLGVLLDPGLLLDVQKVAVARSTYYQLRG